MSDLEFLDTFVGACQHEPTAVKVVWAPRPYFACRFCVTRGRATLRCTKSRPLTDAEIKINLRRP